MSTPNGSADDPTERAYDEALAAGAAQYADVLEALAGLGLPARFTQTGGMCAALEVQLEGGAVLLATDADGSLCWERSDHRGWGVGLYAGDDEELVAFESAEDGSPGALLQLVRGVLVAGRGTRR